MGLYLGKLFFHINLVLLDIIKVLKLVIPRDSCGGFLDVCWSVINWSRVQHCRHQGSFSACLDYNQLNEKCNKFLIIMLYAACAA